METLLLKSKFALLALTFLTIASCSSDDEVSSSIQPPTLSYAATTLDATFFEAGNSATPTLNWNGNQGSFSLTTLITGLNINTTTGTLTWTKNLSLGTHNLEVVATNSAGQTTVYLTLNNPLQGNFTGNYDGSSFFEIEFNSNGTAIIRANSSENPDLATGTWTNTGSTLNIDYTYDNALDKYSLSGTLTTGTSVTYSGNYFFGHDTISGNQAGTFEVILD